MDSTEQQSHSTPRCNIPVVASAGSDSAVLVFGLETGRAKILEER